MIKRKNKNAAIELSVSTVVVIVIAMSMLILGIVLVRKVMCAGIILTDKVTTATENEINNLFDTSEFGVKCMGEGEQVRFGGGGRRQLICVINSLEGGEYNLKVKNIDVLKGAIDPDRIVIDKDWRGSAQPGKKTVTVAVLDVPRNVPDSSLKFNIEVTNPDGTRDTPSSSIIDLVPAGYFTTAIC